MSDNKWSNYNAARSKAAKRGAAKKGRRTRQARENRLPRGVL